MIKCACGCNKELEEYDKYNRIRRFISGHQFFNENIKLKRILNAGRIPWTSEELYFLKENYRTLNNSEIGLKLGRKSVFVYSKMKQLKLFRSKELALELKRRSYSGEKNHNFNKKLNLSSRLKMSYKRRWNFVLGILDYTGYNNPSFGYRWNESQKRRQSVQMKDILKNNFKELTSELAEERKAYTNKSGGSTGEPTAFLQDKHMFDWGMAGRIYFDKIAGHEVGQKVIRLWGSERDLMGRKDPFIRRMKYFFFNRRDLNAFTMTKEKMHKYVEIINKEKPSMIESYVTPIYELAILVESEKLKIHSPQMIITSADTLYPQIKEKIEKIFKTTVWNRYGSREVGGIAMGKDKLKTAYWHNYVEVVYPRGFKDKELGKILVTTLNNYSMPLIRYDIGDIGKESSEWPYLDSVEGRELAAVVNRKGKIIPGTFFVHFFGVVLNKGYIKKFQLIQKSFNTLEIKVVVDNEVEFAKNKHEIEELVNKTMEEECEIIWTKVKSIQNLKSGKYVYVKSELKR